MSKPRLVAISGPWAGSVWLIPPTGLRIGRDPDKNDIVLDDATLSGEHASFDIVDGVTAVHDWRSANGIVVNDVAYLDRALQHGDVIELGISKVVYLEYDDDPNAIPELVRDETDKSLKAATLKVDYSSRGEAAIYQRMVREALGEIGRMLPNITDPEEFLNHAAGLAFRVIPARRIAIIVNGRRGSADPADYRIRIWRERDVPGPSPFRMTSDILEDVMATGSPSITRGIAPVICVPIKLADTVVGYFYLEGRSDTPFEADDRDCAESLAAHMATSTLLGKVVDKIDTDYESLRNSVAPEYRMVGNSEQMQDIYSKVAKVAKTDLPVIITGETGTGKELLARLIHALSARKDKPCVSANCGAIPKELVEGDLFGHKKGAFTGADKDRKGYFEEADQGTLFLDEIGDMPMDAQVKLLRVIESGEFRPIGGESKDIKKVSVRVIAATRVDLNAAMESGKFRDDLFERLNGVHIHLPPLRERPTDIDNLVDYFIQAFGSAAGVTGITDEAREVLRTYHWPRNIRQLRNLLRQTVVLREVAGPNAHLILIEDLPEVVFEEPPVTAAAGPSRVPITKPVLERALHEESWNVKAVAARLNRSFSQIYALMRKFNLKKPAD